MVKLPVIKREKPVCTRCGSICCRPGLVGSGIELHGHEHITREAARKAGVLQPSGDRLTLNGQLCAALGKGGECTIHKDKPVVCKRYPFTPIEREIGLFEICGGCLGVKEFIHKHPESLETAYGRLTVNTELVKSDPMLEKSLSSAVKEYSGGMRFPKAMLLAISDDWLEDPVISKRLEELGKGGLRIKRADAKGKSP